MIALEFLTQYLIDVFPPLANANRVIGHEHAAGYYERGKRDPNINFD